MKPCFLLVDLLTDLKNDNNSSVFFHSRGNRNNDYKVTERKFLLHIQRLKVCEPFSIFLYKYYPKVIRFSHKS